MKNYNNLPTETRQQFISIIIDELEHNCLLDETIIDRYGDLTDLHYKCFNEDSFIIGYYEASKFIDANDLDTFEAIDIVKEYEVDHFGKFTTKIDPESIVNMLAYIYGEELIYSFEIETVEELKEEIENFLK